MSARRHALLALTVLGIAAMAPPTSRAEAQLRAENAPHAALEVRSEAGSASSLPLVNEKLHVRLDDGHALAVYDHSFQNESRARLEGTYRLLVGEGATATGFSYWNGSERIVGEVFEKEAAREVYEALTGLQRDPGLLELTGEGSFSFRVFPIEPAETKHVQVTTSRWLPKRSGKLEYRARLVRADADVEIDLHDARGIDGLESPTHAITTEALPGGGVRLRVGKPKGADTELVVTYAPKDPPGTLRASLHAGETDKFVSISLGTAPAPREKQRPAHDLTLVLDRSGSMEGEPMSAAVEAAKRVVEKLRDDDAVNVIAFDDKVESLFAAPRPLASDVRRDVHRFLSSIHSRGGTDIAKALDKALTSQTKDARPDVVFFLTDGQSSGPPAVEVASRDKSSTTVFTVGLGSGVDKPLLQNIASLRHGRFTFVADARGVTAELPKLLAQLTPPVLTDLTLTTEGGALTAMYPSTLPDVFADDELRVAGRLQGTPSKIVLEAKQNGVPRRFEVALGADATPRPWIARSWALARVDDLLGTESRTADDKERAGVHDEIVDLGLTYALVTPHTSFLALPEKELTGAAKEVAVSMRERRRKLLAMNKDAAALSRSAMPPGDPILRVRAPRDARKVTAYFPFGLVQELAWDRDSERWTTRFLVPNDVPDGHYDVKVAIEHADGRVEASMASYTIDSREPGIDVNATVHADGVHVRVSVDEPAGEVRVVVEGRPDTAQSLQADPDRLGFSGVLAAAPGDSLRVVVADRARNESHRVLRVVAEDTRGASQ